MATDEIETGQHQVVLFEELALDPQDPLDGSLDRPLEPLRRAVIPIEGKSHSIGTMDGAIKRIERVVGHYVGARYHDVVEVGIGRNFTAAEVIASSGAQVRAVDIRATGDGPISVVWDDVFSPTLSLYEGADLVLAIRPGVEMVPPLIALARRCDCDLLVYHLGDEVYLDGGERIPIEGAILHRYHRGGRLEEG